MTGSLVTPTVVSNNTSIGSSVDSVLLINVAVTARVADKYNLSCLRKQGTKKIRLLCARNAKCF